MKVAEKVNHKTSHHKKKIVTVWWQVLTRPIVVIISQYIQISNHYVVLETNIICQLYLRKIEKKNPKTQNKCKSYQPFR